MATLQKVLHTLIPDAVHYANACYQEHLRGTSDQELYVPVAARISVVVVKAFAPYVDGQRARYFPLPSQYSCYSPFVSLITTLALSSLVAKGLRHYGASRGYNVNFNWEVKVLTLTPLACNVVERLTTPKIPAPNGMELDYRSRTDNQKRVALLLNILVGIISSCAIYKFQADRNLSLPLRPYLYFAAGVTILERLQRYNRLDEKLNSAIYLSRYIPSFNNSPYAKEAAFCKFLSS